MQDSPIAVVREAARRNGLTAADLTGPKRSRWVMKARREAAEALRAGYPEMSLCDIAGFLGRKDHTTASNLLGAR